MYSLSVESIWTILNDSKQSGQQGYVFGGRKEAPQDYQVSTGGNQTAALKVEFGEGAERGIPAHL